MCVIPITFGFTFLMKVVGQKIAQLEARKRAAVEKEDYDTAKLIKVDIDKLRAAGESAAGAMEAAALASRNKDPGEIFGRVMRASGNVPMTPASAAADGRVRGCCPHWGALVMPSFTEASMYSPA